MEVNAWHEEARVPVAVLQLKGNFYSAEELVEPARKLYEAGTRNILIDLTQVPYIASSGLRAIHTIYEMLRSDAPEESKEAMQQGIRAGTWTSPHLKLLNPNRNVLQVLKMTGYDMFLEIHRDLKQAIRSF